MGFIIDTPLDRSSGTLDLANVFATKNKIKYQSHNIFKKRLVPIHGIETGVICLGLDNEYPTGNHKGLNIKTLS